MADTDTAPAPTPGVDYNALIQQILQGGGGVTGPAAPATPAVNPNLPITSLLGEAFGGGVSPLYPMSEAQQTQAGNAALLNFGIGMLQNASGPVRHSLGQAIASGLLGAQGSLAGVREGQAQMLDIQNKQQETQLRRLAAVLPLLRMEQAAGMPNPLAGNLAATGDPISALPKDQALAAIVQRESGGKNIPTAILGPDGKPASTATGYYQMLDDTWHEGATLAGIKNPPARAMDASKADQDAAASALYDKYGVVPWKKSAPAAPTTAPPVATAVTGDTKATTTPPAATAIPPGVQIGGPPPAPPGGTGAATGPYTGGGIGATLNQPPSGKPPGVVGALMQGVNLAQATPIIPGTGLTAGPPTIGKPATLATTTPQSTAAPITIGNYNDTPAPATTTPPAQPAPQQPTQADQPPAPGGQLTFEDWQKLHPSVLALTDAERGATTVVPPNLDDLRKAQAAASQQLDMARRGLGGDPNKSLSDYNTATQAITKAQQDAQAKSAELMQTLLAGKRADAQKLYNDDMTRQQQAQLKAQELAQTVAENEKQREAAVALKAQEALQAIELAKVNAGQTWHQKLQEQSAQNAQENTLKPMAEQAAKAHNMNLSLAQLQPLLQDLPQGGGALGAVLNDHPDLAPLFNQAGILNDKSADAVRLVNGLVANISTQMKPTGLGALREYEWDAFKSQLPSMLSTPAGQQKAIALLMNMNNRIGSEASWMNNYFSRKVPDDMSDKPGAMVPAHNLDSDNPTESVQQRMDRELGPIVPSYSGPPSGQSQWEQSLPPGKPYYKTVTRRDPNNPSQPLRDSNGNAITRTTLEVRPWQ